MNSVAIQVIAAFAEEKHGKIRIGVFNGSGISLKKHGCKNPDKWPDAMKYCGVCANAAGAGPFSEVFIS